MRESPKREDELIKAGWTKRFFAIEPRLSEAVELYRSMGFEVHLEPLPLVESVSANEGSQECKPCFKGFEDQYKIIFTRPKRGQSGEDDFW